MLMQLYVNCEGFPLPDYSAGIDRHTTWVQLTPRCFPHLVGLPCASWHNTMSALLQVPGPDWFFKCAEAMRALTSPVPILCTCMRRVVSARQRFTRREPVLRILTDLDRIRPLRTDRIRIQSKPDPDSSR
jgi:hypothetical protein